MTCTGTQTPAQNIIDPRVPNQREREEQALLLAAAELGEPGAELDWSRCAIDSVNMRVMKGGSDRPESCRSGKERLEDPLDHIESRLPPLHRHLGRKHPRQPRPLRGIPPVRSRRGPRRRLPDKLHADKGYDYDHLRRWLRSRNIVPRIARKGVESSARLGRQRWAVERTVSWLSGIRRLHRRYERKPDHFLAFAGIAATLICYRRLNGTATRP